LTMSSPARTSPEPEPQGGSQGGQTSTCGSQTLSGSSDSCSFIVVLLPPS
jgi:hypothetical protein